MPECLLYWAERSPDAVFVSEPDRGREYDLAGVARHVESLAAGQI